MIRPFKYIPMRRLPFRYLPPNFATAANMIMGLLAILFSIKGDFVTAGWMVIWAVFLDSLDGTLARLLKVDSHFGVEFDSFADLVSFGIAPPSIVLCYLVRDDIASAALMDDLWVAIICAFFYILMAAIRLARFNVQTIELGDRLFHGIPTTACAGLIASGFLTLHKYGDPVREAGDLVFMASATLIVCGVLMISMIPLMKFRRRASAALTMLQRLWAFICLVLGVTRQMPDLLFLSGFLFIAGSIRYGVKVDRDLRREKERQKASIILEKRTSPPPP